MKLLDDYIFDDRLRYEGHKLVYTPEGKAPVIFGGILAASVRFMELYNRWRAQLSDPEPYKQFPAFVRTVLLSEQ